MILMINYISIAFLIGVLPVQEPVPTFVPSKEWTRRADSENLVSLEIVSRKYAAEGKPDVWLVGVAHIADSSFYESITSLLDEMDIVLYESVQPAGSRPPSGDSNKERVESTQRSLEFIADIAVRTVEESNVLPESIEDVFIEASLLDRRLSGWVVDASIDAWDNQFVLQVDRASNTLTVSSFGADGIEGGIGVDADITVQRTVTLLDEEEFELDRPEKEGNIQEELANVLGLEFQLDALPYEEPTWFCSDMTIDEVEAKLIERGASTTLLNTLTGDTFAAKLANGLMKLIPIIDGFVGGGIRESARLLMIEMLSMPGSDQLLQGIEPELAQVIIVDRNTVLLGDLAATLAIDTGVTSIGVLYGAGHMHDLEPRLNSIFGYVPVEERWFVSMSVNPKDSLLNEKDMKRMRYMLQLQMHRAKKAREAEESGE